MSTTTGTPARTESTNATRVALVVVLGSFITALDGTVMNVTVPALQEYFRAPDGRLSAYSLVAWTVTGYTLAQAGVIPLTDWGARRFGARRMYLGGITIFTVASLACALAPSLPTLIALRVLQGTGGGFLMPLGQAILARAAGPARLGRMMGLMGVPMMLGPVLGPIVGGLILQVASWHWIFLINVPFGVAAVVAGFFLLPRADGAARVRLDVLSVLTMSPGLALGLWGLSSLASGPASGRPTAVVVLGLGALLVVLFVARSLRLAHPLLDLGVMRDHGFGRAAVVAVTYQMGFFGTLLVVPAYLQQVRGLSMLQVGLVMAPTGIGSMLTMPWAASLVDRLPVGRIVPFGMTVVASSIAALALVSTETPLAVIAVVLLVQGMGLGASMMPTSTAALKTIEHAKIGNATTVFNIVTQVSSALGVALISVVLARRVAAAPLASAAIAGTLPADLEIQGLSQASHAFAGTFWLPASLLAFGLLLALRLPMRAMAATSTPR